MKKLFFLLLITATSPFWAQEMSNDAPVFIIKMGDARLMDREEGRLAASLGTTKEIRDYGTLMVNDQQMLHDKLQQLAQSKDIKLPNAISEKKSKQLKKLSMLTGKPFDRKFLKMIKLDHKRDIRKFKKAMKFEDAATRQFAQDNLPMIERHLEKAKML